MGKAAKCIKMIEALNARQILKINDLADILEINPRNIYEYKKELEEAGYQIDSIPGKYGGYQLNRKNLFPSLRLTLQERNDLLEGFSFLYQRNDFLGKKSFSKAAGKVVSAITFATEEETVPTIINRFPLAMPFAELEERYHVLQEAINQRKVIELDYLSTKNIARRHTLHPYKLFMYNNAWFLLAWNTSVNDYAYFKLNRIGKLELLEKTYIPWRDFDEHDFIDEFGMKQNGDFYHLVLDITEPYTSVIRERIYGKKQTIETMDSKTTRLSVDMQNQGAIITFVLGFGSACTVIEPLWLIDKVKEHAQRMLQKYL